MYGLSIFPKHEMYLNLATQSQHDSAQSTLRSKAWPIGARNEYEVV
jgi:hypothetical protein